MRPERRADIVNISSVHSYFGEKWIKRKYLQTFFFHYVVNTDNKKTAAAVFDQSMKRCQRIKCFESKVC